jgi:pyruvate,water dikinase
MDQDRWIIDVTPSARYPVYTRANAGEVLPDPVSPLFCSLLWMPGIAEGWRDAQISVGTCEPDEVTAEEVTGMFGGRLYINASLARLFGVRGPNLSADMIDRVYFGDHPDVPPYVPEPWHEREANTAKLGAWMQRVLTDDLDVLLEDQAEVRRLRGERPDLARLDDAELVAYARRLVPLVRRLFERHLTVTAGASIGPGIVEAVADALGEPTIALKLLTSVGDIDSAAPSHAMWRLSRLDPDGDDFRRGFAAFLEQHGSRGPNEWDIVSEVWETSPPLALTLIDMMRKQDDDGDPAARAAIAADERVAITQRVRAALEADPDTLAQFEAGLQSAHRYLAGRERTKTNIIVVIHEARMAMRELGARHGYTPTEVMMLLDDELDAFVAAPEEFRVRLDQRAREYAELGELEPPFIVDGVVAPLREWSRRSDGAAAPVAAPGDVLHGVPGCPGITTGTARVVLDPADPVALEPGDILVAPITDPAWTPLFVPASGVVVNVGAQVSHAIIVSRELGIPCVVSVTGATDRIEDGALVTVDGDAGTVTVH